ncbi:MAG: T9SS type A sorting domain-containing protein [Bacteroidetes bacterium]|nr:T9SS type A sorting domain-containing protein [Bacteroidota bacterium]
MKRTAIAFCFLIGLFAAPVSAQTIVDINNPMWSGTPSNSYSYVYSPTWYYYYDASNLEIIYTASELIAAGAPAGGGKIQAIAMHGYTMGSYINVLDELIIKVSHTQQNNWQVPVTRSNEIVARSGQWTIPNISSGNRQYVRFEFDQPFEWDGSSNVIIHFCMYMGNMVYSNNQTWHNVMYARYGYVNYPPTYNQSEYRTRYRYHWAYYGPANQDYCQAPGTGQGYYGPYATFVRPDMRFEICDGEDPVYASSSPGLQYLPGTLPVDWSLGHPTESFTATVTISLYTPADVFVTSQSFTLPINANSHSGTYNLPLNGVPPGYYRLEVRFNALDECDNMSDFDVNRAVMILEPGSTPCEVWPGDANRDGVVNYGDRAGLNKYIHDAMLNPMWLTGPARYRADVDVNPLTYLQWEAQYGVPWSTPDGCHMDTDGNGVINNFDYIAIKMNWSRVQGNLQPTKSPAFDGVGTFAMDQNYPNPFNPTTSIRYSAPERSHVTLTVTDMLGRTVSTLVNGTVEAGVHTATFDAADLTTGNYMATIRMAGAESDLSFSKSIKMVLNK